MLKILTREKLATSQQSRDLTDDPLEVTSLDWVRATGIVSQHEPLGVMLYQLKYSDFRCKAKQVLLGVTEVVIESGIVPRGTLVSSAVLPVVKDWFEGKRGIYDETQNAIYQWLLDKEARVVGLIRKKMG